MKAQFKKLNLLVFHREREEITDMLQEIGVLDVEVDTEFRSEDVQEQERQKNNFTKAIEVVEEQAGKKYQSIEKTEVSIEEVAKKVMELKYRNEENVQKRESLRKEKLQRLPWGDLNLEKLYRLQEHGLEAQFYMATLKEFKKFDFKSLVVQVVYQSSNRVYFVVIAKEKFSLPFESVKILV